MLKKTFEQDAHPVKLKKKKEKSVLSCDYHAVISAQCTLHQIKIKHCEVVLTGSPESFDNAAQCPEASASKYTSSTKKYSLCRMPYF